MRQADLIDYLIASGVLKTPDIIRAFKKINRKDFILAADKDNPYGDYPLSIGYSQTISQPTTVVFMLELLQPRTGEKVLDVGSGSGWTTALIAEIIGQSGRVYGVEKVPELVEFGKNNLKRYDFSQAEILSASGKLGLPPKSPFDKILVSATANDLPQELIDQLKIGGRLVIPINNSIWQIDKISAQKIKQQEFPGFVFVPLVND